MAALRALAACASVLLASCAQVPSAPAPDLSPRAAASFNASGRLSARHGNEGVAANFDWVHEGARDEVSLITPLGQTVAQLSGDTDAVRIDFPDGRHATANDWDALTRAQLGSPIPVRGLAAWLRGGPREGATSEVERDGRGRAGVLRQDGWEVVYGYADDARSDPSRLTLRYAADPTIEVRIAIDRWQ